MAILNGPAGGSGELILRQREGVYSAQLDNNITLDLNVEGWKVLVTQLVPTYDNQGTPGNHTEHFQAADLQRCANKLR